MQQVGQQLQREALAVAKSSVQGELSHLLARSWMDGRADHSALIGFRVPPGRCAITAVTTSIMASAGMMLTDRGGHDSRPSKWSLPAADPKGHAECTTTTKVSRTRLHSCSTSSPVVPLPAPCNMLKRCSPPVHRKLQCPWCGSPRTHAQRHAMWGQAQGLSIALSDFLNGRYLPRLLASGSLACLVESGVLQSLFLVDHYWIVEVEQQVEPSTSIYPNR